MSPLAALRRLPGLRPTPPRPVRPTRPPVSAGLLVQRWNRCPLHSHQLVSVLEPGCNCPTGGAR